jgi:hypothetical protein
VIKKVNEDVGFISSHIHTLWFVYFKISCVLVITAKGCISVYTQLNFIISEYLNILISFKTYVVGANLVKVVCPKPLPKTMGDVPTTPISFK